MSKERGLIYVNAKIFAEAYTNHFCARTTIVKKGA